MPLKADANKKFPKSKSSPKAKDTSKKTNKQTKQKGGGTTFSQIKEKIINDMQNLNEKEKDVQIGKIVNNLLNLTNSSSNKPEDQEKSQTKKINDYNIANSPNTKKSLNNHINGLPNDFKSIAFKDPFNSILTQKGINTVVKRTMSNIGDINDNFTSNVKEYGMQPDVIHLKFGKKGNPNVQWFLRKLKKFHTNTHDVMKGQYRYYVGMKYLDEFISINFDISDKIEFTINQRVQRDYSDENKQSIRHSIQSFVALLHLSLNNDTEFGMKFNELALSAIKNSKYVQESENKDIEAENFLDSIKNKLQECKAWLLNTWMPTTENEKILKAGIKAWNNNLKIYYGP